MASETNRMSFNKEGALVAPLRDAPEGLKARYDTWEDVPVCEFEGGPVEDGAGNYLADPFRAQVLPAGTEVSQKGPQALWVPPHVLDRYKNDAESPYNALENPDFSDPALLRNFQQSFDNLNLQAQNGATLPYKLCRSTLRFDENGWGYWVYKGNKILNVPCPQNPAAYQEVSLPADMSYRDVAAFLHATQLTSVQYCFGDHDQEVPHRLFLFKDIPLFDRVITRVNQGDLFRGGGGEEKIALRKSLALATVLGTAIGAARQEKADRDELVAAQKEASTWQKWAVGGSLVIGVLSLFFFWRMGKMQKEVVALQKKMMGGDIDPATLYTDQTEEAKKPDFSQIDVGPEERERLNRMDEITAKQRQRHILLTGGGGSGKDALTDHYKGRVARGEVPHLQNYRIIRINLVDLEAAGARYAGMPAKALKAALDIGYQEPVLLHIQEAHLLSQIGVAEGHPFGIGEMLKDAMTDPRFKGVVIGTTDQPDVVFTKPGPDGRSRVKDEAQMRRWNHLDMPKTTLSRVLRILRRNIKNFTNGNGEITIEEGAYAAIAHAAKLRGGSPVAIASEIADELIARCRLRGIRNIDVNLVVQLTAEQNQITHEKAKTLLIFLAANPQLEKSEASTALELVKAGEDPNLVLDMIAAQRVEEEAQRKAQIDRIKEIAAKAPRTAPVAEPATPESGPPGSPEEARATPMDTPPAGKGPVPPPAGGPKTDLKDLFVKGMGGGAAFFVGMYGAKALKGVATGDFSELKDLKASDLAASYLALAAGGGGTQVGLQSLAARHPNSKFLNHKVTGRGLPLLSAILLNELVMTGTIQTEQIPLTMGNILAASTATHNIARLAKAAAKSGGIVRKIGAVLKLTKAATAAAAPASGGTSVVGTLALTLLEFTILEALAAGEQAAFSWWNKREMNQEVSATIQKLEALDKRFAKGEEVFPELLQTEMALAALRSAVTQQSKARAGWIREEGKTAVAELQKQRDSELAIPLSQRGTRRSNHEINTLYGEKIRDVRRDVHDRLKAMEESESGEERMAILNPAKGGLENQFTSSWKQMGDQLDRYIALRNRRLEKTLEQMAVASL